MYVRQAIELRILVLLLLLVAEYTLLAQLAERRFLACELTRSCARPSADG